MQVIYKVDIVFLVLQACLIVGIGGALAFALGSFVLFGFVLGIVSIYLYRGLRRPFRRYRAIKKPFPEPWRNFLSQNSVFYRNLNIEGKTHFENDLRLFLTEYSISGIQGHEVNLDTKLLVAAGVVTVIHGRPYWEPPLRDGILVYPGESFNQRYELNRGNRIGLATINSPLILTEASLKESFLRADDGHNVVIHELAHYFDFEDGKAKGIPSAWMNQLDYEKWKTIIHDEYENAGRGISFLRDYAGTNEAELFAVAVECFFENPRLMVENNPQLYHLLKDFFNLDTLNIMEIKQ